MKNSDDKDIRDIYNHRAEREASLSTWKGTKETSEVEYIAITHKLSFAGQTHRLGLGNGCYKTDLSPSEFRKKCTSTISEIETEKYWAHANGLNLQGVVSMV